MQTLVTLKGSKKKITEQEDEEPEEEEEDFNEQEYVDALGTGTEGVPPADETS